MRSLVFLVLFFTISIRAEVVQVHCAKDAFSTYNLVSAQSRELQNILFSDLDECESFLSLLKDSAFNKKEYSREELLTPFKIQESSAGYTYKDCEDWKYDNHIIKSKRGLILEECLPDTLYSWGHFNKLSDYIKRFGQSGDWNSPLKRPLYLTPSPLATYAYGEIPIRFKLRKGVKAILSTDDKNFQGCLGLKDKHNTILVRYYGSRLTFTGVDYIICSMGVVDSWSFGTEEHYDEILREYHWVETHSYEDYELYVKNRGKDILWDIDLDFHDFTKKRFFSNIEVFRNMIDNNMGKVFEQQEGGKETHFKTKHPIYFNPD